MSAETPETPETDPTLAVAERQLVLLGELTEIVMVAARAFGASAVAAAEAEKTIVSEDWFTPEVGRARACGAKDAAESLQKVARAARLTMKLQMTVAEIVRDNRAGIVTHTQQAKDAGGTPADLDGPLVRRRPAGSDSADRDTDWTRSDTNTERLVEFDRPETLPQAPFRETVDEICAAVGAAVDWTNWKVGAAMPEQSTSNAEPLNFPAPPWRLGHPAELALEPALPP